MLLTLRSVALLFLHLGSYLNLIVQLSLLSYLTRMVLFYLTFKLEDLLLYLLTRQSVVPMLCQQQLLIEQLKRTVFVLPVDLHYLLLQKHFPFELLAHLYLQRLHSTNLAQVTSLDTFYLDLLS